MELITYKQAAEILAVKYGTVKDAVLYGKLTKCATVKKEAVLMREQVELFKNKRISLKALTLEEKREWEEYKRIAEDSEILTSMMTRTNEDKINLAKLAARQLLTKSEGIKIEKANEAADNGRKLLREILISVHIQVPEELEITFP